jgi:hypothetical protein
MDRENIDINGINAERFVSDLWRKIIDSGFNALSKNDFYDYVLYLFNKYNAEPFLDVNSNYQNSQLLRITEQKLKNSTRNIYLKYYKDAEKENLLKLFFEKIAGKKIILKTDNEDAIKQYHLVIEDLRIRTQLEGILKEYAGTTLDYHFNTELVKLETKDFYTLFLSAMAPLSDTAGLKQKIQQIKTDEQTAELLNALANTTKDAIIAIVETLSPIPAGKIIALTQKIIKVFK